MLLGLSSRSAFVFSINSLILSGFSFFSFSWSRPRPQSSFKEFKTSFSSSSYSENVRGGQAWAESSLSTFSWLYILVCVVVQKNPEMFFLKKCFLLILLSTCFICITWRRKQTMEQQPHRALWINEIKQKPNNNNNNKVTSHSNWPLISRFSPKTMQWQWLHCLTSESKGRFLANNIRINFFFNKKIKIERLDHSLTLHPLTSDNISFYPSVIQNKEVIEEVLEYCVNEKKLLRYV